MSAPTVELTHPDKLRFPADGITKGEVFRYYDRIAPWLLPHLRDRMIVLQRFPEGIEEEGFFQKRPSDYFPDRIATKEVPQKTDDEPISYIVCNDKATLLYLVNQGTICFHRQLSTIHHIHAVTHMVIDLDPAEGVSLSQLRVGVQAVHTFLGKDALLMTTGGKGFHVLLPFDRPQTFDYAKAFAIHLSREMIQRFSSLFTDESRLDKRIGKIYLDIQRNNYGQTAVCPYSLRAKPGAPVATPLKRSELGHVSPQRYTIRNIFRRLGQRKKEAWEERQ